MLKPKIERAYEILKSYVGPNPAICLYRSQYESGKLILSEFQRDYILANHNYIPFTVNRIIKISPELGKELYDKYSVGFLPDRVKIFDVVGEMGGSYHCYVQYRKSVAPQLMFLKKKYLLSALRIIDPSTISVDFDRFDKLTEKDGRKLKEHQKSAVRFLLANERCILADSMGLGKSNSAIVASMAAESKKILIITTASLKSTWKRELMLYNDEKEIEVVKAGKKWKQNARFTIVNYELVKNFYKVPQEQATEIKYLSNADGSQTEIRVPVYTKDKKTGKLKPKMVKSRRNATIAECMAESPLYQMKFDCVIVDEAQKLSNHTSIRYKVIEDFVKRSGVRYVFLLTGTPLTNNPINLYRILRLLDAEITDDYNYYCKRYCGGREMKLSTGKKIMMTDGATHLDELRDRIKHLYIRRLISDLPDMVHKEISTRYYDLDDRQQKRYEELWDEYVDAQKNIGKYDSESYRQLVEGMLVRQYLAQEMIPNTVQLVNEIIEDGEKVIIVCTFQEELDKFKAYYKDKCVCYDGRMSVAQKDASEKAFMTDPNVKVFVGNINAASLGLTLTIAKKMVFNSYSWEEITNRQMQDRIWRITQTDDVECIYQLFTDSISQHMFNSVIRKGMIMDEVIKSENDKKK